MILVDGTITLVEHHEKCTKQYARDVRKNVKYRLSLLKDETFFVKSVLRKTTLEIKI